MSFGKAILGDNQFLGVNHYSQARAAESYQRFSKPDAILEVLGWAYDSGVRDFMFTTHERFPPVFEEIRRSNLFPGMHYSPCLPYAHKYAGAMAEKGMIEVVWDTLAETSKAGILQAAVRAGMGDFSGLMRLLVQIELLMCKGLPVRGVFLQNIMFDLLLGLNARSLVEEYHRFVTDRLQVIPGFITMNHPGAVAFLVDDVGLRDPWLCANLNMGGFRTHPSLQDVQESFATKRSKNIAMSVFAPGAGPADSLDFVLQSAGVDSILFGSSTHRNVVDNVARILGHPVAGAA